MSFGWCRFTEIKSTRVAITGLDRAPQEPLLDRWKDAVPTLSPLMDTDIYGPLESTILPITVSSWNYMMTAKDRATLVSTVSERLLMRRPRMKATWRITRP